MVTFALSGADPVFRRRTDLLGTHKHGANRCAERQRLTRWLQFAGVGVNRERDDGIGCLIFRDQPVAGRVNRKMARRAAHCGLVFDEREIAGFLIH